MSSNQRACFRCPAPAEGSQALLELPRKQLMVEMIDQSASGFSIQFRGKRRVRLGQILKLRSNAGWSEVEVVRVEKNGAQTRVGMRRVRDLSDPRMEAILRHNSLPPLLGSATTRAKKGLLGTVLTTILAFIIAFWISVSQPIWLARISDWWRVQTWTKPSVTSTSANPLQHSSRQ